MGVRRVRRFGFAHFFFLLFHAVNGGRDPLRRILSKKGAHDGLYGIPASEKHHVLQKRLAHGRQFRRKARHHLPQRLRLPHLLVFAGQSFFEKGEKSGPVFFCFVPSGHIPVKRVFMPVRLPFRGHPVERRSDDLLHVCRSHVLGEKSSAAHLVPQFFERLPDLARRRPIYLSFQQIADPSSKIQLLHGDLCQR